MADDASFSLRRDTLQVDEGVIKFKCEWLPAPALTELDLRIAQDAAYDLINLSVLALPIVSEEAVSTFLAEGSTLAYPER